MMPVMTPPLISDQPIFIGSPESSCPICVDDPMIDPQQLLCGHVCCLECFEKLFEMQEVQVECFACRQRISIATSLDTGLIRLASEMRRNILLPTEGNLDAGSQSEDREWPIDCILDHRGQGVSTRYLVLWTTGESSWEPARNFVPGGLAALRSYRRGLRRRNMRRLRQRRRASSSLSNRTQSDEDQSFSIFGELEW